MCPNNVVGGTIIIYFIKVTGFLGSTKRTNRFSKGFGTIGDWTKCKNIKNGTLGRHISEDRNKCILMSKFSVGTEIYRTIE